jgi:type IV pilus assembly protein PilW
MVAMTLSLLLLGGVLSVVQGSKVTYLENERVGRLQETGRTAVELILRDLRAAGFGGCARVVNLRNVLHNANTLLWNFSVPLQGFNYTSSGTWTPAIDTSLLPSPSNSSDIIAVRTVRSGAISAATSVAMVAQNSPLQVTKQADDALPLNRTMLISDCGAAATFMATSPLPAGSTAVTLTHTSQAGAPSPTRPANASDDLGATFRDGAQIVPIDTVVYYVRDSATVRNRAGVNYTNPALWRRVSSNVAEQELIEGVQSMQILYGEDTTGTNVVGAYRTAAAVVNWQRVISVSIAILVRSVEQTATDIDRQTYTLLDTTLGPFNDRFERTLYTTTVSLRNETE